MSKILVGLELKDAATLRRVARELRRDVHPLADSVERIADKILSAPSEPRRIVGINAVGVACDDGTVWTHNPLTGDWEESAPPVPGTLEAMRRAAVSAAADAQAR